MNKIIIIPAILGVLIGTGAAGELRKPDRVTLTSIALTTVTNRYTDLAESDLSLKMLGYLYAPESPTNQEYFFVSFRVLGTKTVQETERSTITTEDEIDVEIRPDGTVLPESVTRSARKNEDFEKNSGSRTTSRSK